MRQKMWHTPVTFKVTPKDTGGPRPLLARLTAPFAGLAVMLSSVALYGELTSPAAGYVFLCLIGGTAYAAVALAVPVLHVREAARASAKRFKSVLWTARLSLALGVLSSLPAAAAIIFYPAYAAAVLGW
ncbi:hypothetical protein ACFPN0_00070 [Kitasatospora cinereorecta]